MHMYLVGAKLGATLAHACQIERCRIALSRAHMQHPAPAALLAFDQDIVAFGSGGHSIRL